jgi:hypothetical protein
MPEEQGRLNPNCEIEYAARFSDEGLPCGRRAVAECADCGNAICEDCRIECCRECSRDFCFLERHFL